MDQGDRHLFDMNPREAEAVNRVLVHGQGLFGWRLQPLMNWPLPWMWLALRIPHDRLVGKAMAAEHGWKGDVDVFGGPLLWEDDPVVVEAHARFAASGGAYAAQLAASSLVEEDRVPWPPDLRSLTAAEVKAARYDQDGALKSTGLNPNEQRHARKQAKVLCDMGFDRVLLLRFLAGEAVYDAPSPWLEAAGRNAQASQDHGAATIFEPDDPFGTVTIGVGAVPAGAEHLHGAGGVKVFQAPPLNPVREAAGAVAAMRAVKDAVAGVLATVGQPKRFPVVVLACSSNRCARLYASPANPALPCPSCGAAPL